MLYAPPAGSGAQPQPKSNLVHFSLKIRHLVAAILMIFLRVLPKIFLWPHYSGALGARGSRFIEPPEPPVPTPLFAVLKPAGTRTLKTRYTRIDSVLWTRQYHENSIGQELFAFVFTLPRSSRVSVLNPEAGDLATGSRKVPSL